jgi:hypothetical protein
LTKKYEEAQRVLDRALPIRVKALGNQDPAVAETINTYAMALNGLHRLADGERMQRQAQAILDRHSK